MNVDKIASAGATEKLFDGPVDADGNRLRRFFGADGTVIADTRNADGRCRKRGGGFFTAQYDRCRSGRPVLNLLADDGRYTAGFQVIVKVCNFQEMSFVSPSGAKRDRRDHGRRPASNTVLFLGKKLQFDRTDLDHVEFIQRHGLFDRFAIDLRFG